MYFPMKKERLYMRMQKEYESIKLPRRAHPSDAAYDFYMPFDLVLDSKQTAFFWTGIRVCLDPNKVLLLMPRSGLGSRYFLNLANQTGVIDASYYFADNEGHIGCKLINNSPFQNECHIAKGQAVIQGIITKYYTVDDDCPRFDKRSSGFGSSDKNSNNS